MAQSCFVSRYDYNVIKTRHRILVICLLGIVSCLTSCIAVSAEKKTRSLHDLSWMVGSWVEYKSGMETEEHWIAPKVGLMPGMSRTTLSNGKTSFEFLRLARTLTGISPAVGAIYLTNRKNLAVEEVVELAKQRCHQANVIAQLKGAVAATRMPVDDQTSNWACLVMTTLA